MTDVIVVGSGASGVMAAVPLVAAGLRVLMLDVGAVDSVYAPLVPARPWSDIRRTDANQHRYFLGDRFEGVPFGARVGAQLTPPRGYVAADAATLLPRTGEGFVGLESLAVGGLASAWGAAVSPWSDEDFAGLPISLADLLPHYDAVADLMGVCGEGGDGVSAFVHDAPTMMPPLDLDTGAARILARYKARHAAANRGGLYLGRARLAACSREHRGRGPHPYLDTDFWADHGRAVYRPRYTLDELRDSPNFEFAPGHLVHTFRDGPGGVEVVTRRRADHGEAVFHARTLVLAAGALGTARVVLRSLGRYDEPVSLVSNHSPYFPMLNSAMLGVEPDDRRHSLTQLTGFFRPRGGGGLVQLQVYSYRSLLTFKLLREQPLAFPQGRRVLRALLPMLALLGIHHEDNPGPTKAATLRRSERAAPGAPADVLETRYALAPGEQAAHEATERQVLAAFRGLGCFGLKRVHLGYGASIHYGGTLPMRAGGAPLTCDAAGRLAEHPAVRLADSAVFPRLPAKGVTFTMMAHAHRVGTLLAGELAR